MSGLLEQIANDLKSAMKERREGDLAVLRMLKAELQRFHADKGVAYSLTDDDVHLLVRRLVKQRRDAAEQYRVGGAEDRAQAELDEILVLGRYLPQAMSEAEIEALVNQAIESLGGHCVMKDLGRIMGLVMPQTQGRADGNAVRQMATRILSLD